MCALCLRWQMPHSKITFCFPRLLLPPICLAVIHSPSAIWCPIKHSVIHQLRRLSDREWWRLRAPRLLSVNHEKCLHILLTQEAPASKVHGVIHLAEMALVWGFILIPVIKHLRLKVSFFGKRCYSGDAHWEGRWMKLVIIKSKKASHLSIKIK